MQKMLEPATHMVRPEVQPPSPGSAPSLFNAYMGDSSQGSFTSSEPDRFPEVETDVGEGDVSAKLDEPTDVQASPEEELFNEHPSPTKIPDGDSGAEPASDPAKEDNLEEPAAASSSRVLSGPKDMFPDSIIIPSFGEIRFYAKK